MDRPMYNECGFKVPEFSKTITLYQISPTPIKIKKPDSEDVLRQGLGFNVINKRFQFVPLFQNQEIINSFNNKRLHHLDIRVCSTTYHGENEFKIDSLDIDDNYKEIKLNKLIAPSRITLNLVKICGIENLEYIRDIAREPYISPSDIYENFDINDISKPILWNDLKYKEYVKPIQTLNIDTECETNCLLKEQYGKMCFNFGGSNGEDVCILSSNKNENILFNTGLYGLIITIDYCPTIFDIKRSISDYENDSLVMNDENTYQTDFNDNFLIGNTGVFGYYKNLRILGTISDTAKNSQSTMDLIRRVILEQQQLLK